MRIEGLEIPEELVRLLDAGLWPRTEQEANAQQVKPLVSEDLVRALAPEESTMFLLPPPFRTVESCWRGGEDFWAWDMAAPDGIVFERTIPIADFGLGSDAPIVLDYRRQLAEPAVLRLRYGQTHAGNAWVTVAVTFGEFVEALRLWDRR